MTIHQSFGPKADTEVSPFMNKLNNALTADMCLLFNVSTGVGSRKEQLEHDTQNADYILKVASTNKAEKEQITSTKDLLIWGKVDQTVTPITVTAPAAPPATLMSGIITRTLELAQCIKKNPNYTEAIGKLMGIVGPVIVIDESTMKPIAKLRENMDNKVVINLIKGQPDMIAVYCNTVKDGDELLEPGLDAIYDFRGVFSQPPYFDQHLNLERRPETRKYKFYYMKHDKIIGLASDVITVVAHVYMAADGSELQGKVK